MVYIGMDVTMIIIWSLVIGGALLVEFMTYSLISVWFAVGGIAALISVPVGVTEPWQILIFFAVSFAFLAGLRPFVKRFVKAPTVPTNVDAEVGKSAKLLRDVVDGISEIKIGDTYWKVICDGDYKTGSNVFITGLEGNKYVVTAKSPAPVLENETKKEIKK